MDKSRRWIDEEHYHEMELQRENEMTALGRAWNGMTALEEYEGYKAHAGCSHNYATPSGFAAKADAAMEELATRHGARDFWYLRAKTESQRAERAEAEVQEQIERREEEKLRAVEAEAQFEECKRRRGRDRARIAELEAEVDRLKWMLNEACAYVAVHTVSDGPTFDDCDVAAIRTDLARRWDKKAEAAHKAEYESFLAERERAERAEAEVEELKGLEAVVQVLAEMAKEES